MLLPIHRKRCYGAAASDQVDDLPEMIAGTDVELALIALTEAIESFEDAETALAAAKRNLATAMRK